MKTEQFIEEYMPLVQHIANNACKSSRSIDVDDLCQVGRIAIVNAIHSYDVSRGDNIKAYVLKSVRRAIYNEAARFLGIFTVDHRVTALAAKVNNLYTSGKTNKDICEILNLRQDHVRDLISVYSKNQPHEIPAMTIAGETSNFMDVLNELTKDDIDRTILQLRILGTSTIKEVMIKLNITKKIAYERESLLKIRIRKAIEEMA